MDFFEKAHVVKRESSRKDTKTDETIKKQLKKILTGYKQHDNKLIKISDDTSNAINLLDESSSVSGFSDLNISNSSNEADTMRVNVGSDVEDYMNTLEDENQSALSSICKDNSSSDFYEDGDGSDVRESISECDDSMQTLSDNGTDPVEISSSSEASKASSLDLSLDRSTTDSHVSEFDADGRLADKILQRLKNKGVAKNKSKKRKFEEDEQSVSLENDAHESYDEFLQLDDMEEISSSQSFQNTNQESKDDEEPLDDNTSEASSVDFVSIAVSDMPNQKLSDIVGHYKYPVHRVIPEKPKLKSTKNAGNFSVEDINVDTTIQDDENEDSDVCITEPMGSDEHNSSESEAEQSQMTDQGQIERTPENSDDDTVQTVISEKDSVSTAPENTIRVFYGNETCIFLMKNTSEMYLNGKVLAKTLKGRVDILGYRVGPEACEVYAPNYNYAYRLKPHASECVDSLLFKLRLEGLSDADAKEIVIEQDRYDCIVSLKKLNSHKLQFVENSIPVDLFSKISKNVDSALKTASELLGCSLYLTRPCKAFEELSSERQVLESALADDSRGIICGGKGVGKSTFLRYCVNRLLARGPVVVVDLDPGQAEFTPAGSISATVVDTPLLGPNFTHLKTPQLMLNMGMINTMDNPRLYAQSAAALIRLCHRNAELKSMPWLVNTMGMCNGMGLKFLTQIIAQIQPTYLLQIDSKNSKKRFEILLNPENVKNVFIDKLRNDPIFKNITWPDDFSYTFFIEHHTDFNPKKTSTLAPRDERYLNYLAYFSELVKKGSNGLLSIKPYEVHLKDLNIGLNIKIRKEAVARVINGKIIALCQQTSDDKTGNVFTLKNAPMLCHGHGLIRGIDFEKEILYIVTPVPVEKLSQVDTLVYADWVPELRGQEKHLPEGLNVPYRTSTMYQSRQLMFTPKRRFNPIQLLKMSRNT